MAKKIKAEFDAEKFVDLPESVLSKFSEKLVHDLAVDNYFVTLTMIQGFIDDVAEYNRLPNRFYKRKRILADAIVMESKYVLKIVKDYIAVLPPVKFKRYGELTANVKK